MDAQFILYNEKETNSSFSIERGRNSILNIAQESKALIIISRIIRSATIIILAMALFFSFQSDTLRLDQLSNHFIVCIWLLLLVAFMLMIRPCLGIARVGINLILKHKSGIFWSLFILLTIYQIIILLVINVRLEFDAQGLLNGLHDKTQISSYLSYNPNNRFIFFLFYGLHHLFGIKLFGLQVINLILIDFAIVLVKLIGDTLFSSKAAGYLAAVFFMFFVGVEPLFIVPYTDTYSFVPALLSFYLLINVAKKQVRNYPLLKMVAAGCLLMVSYLIRPSTIIFFIAIVCLVPFLLNNRAEIKSVIRNGIIFILGALAILLLFNGFIKQQSIVNIDPSKEIPLTHFLLLGSFGNENQTEGAHGTWNAGDVALTYSKKTKAEKNKAELNEFIKRTKQRKFSGSLKFYSQKYRQNVDAGVVGYHRDGLWFQGQYDHRNTIKNKIQQIYYPDGYLRPTFNFICQIVWILTLMLAIIGVWYNRRISVSLISLTLIGGILFLEIFESGGTKYLLQYIPYICLLSGVGGQIITKKMIKYLKLNR